MLDAFDFTSAIDGGRPFAAVDDVGAASAIDPADLKLLCEIGVLAMAIERGPEALPIFELLEREQPDNAAGPIGIAMIEVARGRQREAFARLRQAISRCERCTREAKAVLCVLLTGLGRAPEARSLRKELLRGPDSGARRLVAAYGVSG